MRPAGRSLAAPDSVVSGAEKKAFDRDRPVWPPRANAADDRLGGGKSGGGLPPQPKKNDVTVTHRNRSRTKPYVPDIVTKGVRTNKATPSTQQKTGKTNIGDLQNGCYVQSGATRAYHQNKK